MDNKEESLRLLREAKEDFERARRYYELKDWVTVVHYAQLAIEKAAKAIISCFEAYEWTHDPSGQIERLVKKGLLENEFMKIAGHAREAAPWHGRSTYGGLRGGVWRSPSELCTEDVASNLLLKSEDSVRKAEEFLRRFWHDGNTG
ncbi:HEPN domain-containing protein [Candidatus Methanodesulfokora washburnensis]|uniref:HEPN domain-containing protein n=1 Tax=Candidatus Methanodesulfokora washburnensis TaxID=2478471 RepID=UPI0013866C73|nr:HEPN domain-containing protein [Candidatus Methanodesulfokores washburnensis]